MKKISFAVLLLTAISFTTNVQAQEKMKMDNGKMGGGKTVQVGGAPMYPSKSIIENAVNSKDHTTLVAAVKAAGLVQTLEGKGPFTVFAPTNEAFEKLPAGTVSNLVKPENKATLTTILTYHVVPGKIDSKELMKWVKKGNGIAELTTVEGSKLWVMQNADGLWLKDEKGNTAKITIEDVYQSNGVIHVIDTVLMPK
ncbi:MAG: fasciclin domain-containing protein [Flavisolibacter sp.]